MKKIEIDKELKKILKTQTLIKFPDGSAWFNLNRSQCTEEGESMGHCGNVARGLTGRKSESQFSTG